jgi:hypothetical protein
VCVCTCGMGWLRLAGSLKIQVFFAEYRSLLQDSLAKETYIFKGPTNRRHPMMILLESPTHKLIHNQLWVPVCVHVCVRARGNNLYYSLSHLE